MKGFLIKNDVKYISTITFTGGEPALKPELIKTFINICEELNIDVGSFYIATNGTITNKEFIDVLMDLWLFCSDNEMSAVDVSKTDYHILTDEQERATEKLKVLRFVNDKSPLDYHYIIAEGRGVKQAKLNGTIDNARRISPEKLTFNKKTITEGEVYLNVNGDILTCCDLSYKRQDKLKIGNYTEGTIKELATNKNLIEFEDY